MSKLTPSKNARLVAEQYSKLEFRKIFSDVKDKKIWLRLDRSLEKFIERDGETSFWNLVAAISEGWQVNNVYYITSNTKYAWKLQNIPIEKIILTGMSPIIDKYIIRKFNGDPLKFVKAWHNDKKMRKEILKTGYYFHKERDYFPVLFFQSGEKFKVFDGMHRTILALINGKKKIKAWVGYEVNPKGKPLISTNRCWFLSNIHKVAKVKNIELERSIIKIGKEIIVNFRNGKKVLIKRIAGWSHDPEIKRIFKKMIK